MHVFVASFRRVLAHVLRPLLLWTLAPRIARMPLPDPTLRRITGLPRGIDTLVLVDPRGNLDVRGLHRLLRNVADGDEEVQPVLAAVDVAAVRLVV